MRVDVSSFDTTETSLDRIASELQDHINGRLDRLLMTGQTATVQTIPVGVSRNDFIVIISYED